MADLTTVDPTQPLDTELASLGASRIREERAGIVGFAALEHYLTGIHKIPSGNTAARPGAGNTGRLYINQEHAALEWDTGSAWSFLAGTGVFNVNNTTLPVIGAAPILMLSQAFNSSANSHCISIGMARVINATALNQTVFMVMGVDGAVTPLRSPDPFLTSPGTSTIISWTWNSLTEGAHLAGMTLACGPGTVQHVFSQMLLLVL